MKLSDPDSLNLVIGRVLRYGVLVSGTVILLGALSLAAGYSYEDTSSLLTYNPLTVPHGNFPVSLGSLLSGLASFDAYAVIELGVILLIATPVSRVLISVLLFAAEGDRTYVIVTAVVLSLLLFSMLVTPFIPGFHA